MKSERIRSSVTENIVEAHKKNPDLTYNQVADLVGCSSALVRKVAQRRQLSFTNKNVKMIVPIERQWVSESEKPKRKRVSKAKPKKFVPMYYGRASAGYPSASYLQLM